MRQDTLHGIRSKWSLKSRPKHAILGRLKIGSLSKKKIDDNKRQSYTDRLKVL